MHMSVNEKYLKGRQRRAGWLQALGLGLVLVSFVLSLGLGVAYWVVLLAYPALIVGFPMWQYGRGQVRYWKAMQAIPPVVQEEVRPGPKQHIFAFLPLGATVVDYVLVTAEGVFVISMRGVTEGLVAAARGETEYKTGGFTITCRTTERGDRWTQRLPILERLARIGEVPLGNPSAAVQRDAERMREWLAANVPTRQPVPVWGLVVFRNPKTPLDIESSHVEVIHLNELHSFLAFGQYFEQNMNAVVPADDRNRITAAMQALLGPEVAAPAAPVAKAPARKLSPAARQEQARVRAIREQRAAAAASEAPADGAAKSGGRRARGSTPGKRPGAGAAPKEG